MSILKKGEEALKEVLDELEQDMWVRSVWTYQEVVNNDELRFVGEDSRGVVLDGEQFLNALGYYMITYRKHIGITGMQLRRLYPNLDAFEDLVVDWRLSGYGDRSALEILSNMDRRTYDDPRNFFYSMIGAVTHIPSKRTSNPTIESLAESFMEACEEKGDYSYIFTGVPRDDRPGCRWRPRPQMLRSIISWHSVGDKLEGIKEDGFLRLKEMVVTHRTSETDISSRARRWIIPWLEEPDLDLMAPVQTIILKLSEALRFLAFTGSLEPIFTPLGLFFPQEEIAAEVNADICISGSLHYVFGCPGIAVIKTKPPRYVIGVFAGYDTYVKDDVPRVDVLFDTSGEDERS